jgi:hypothetical protein
LEIQEKILKGTRGSKEHTIYRTMKKELKEISSLKERKPEDNGEITLKY